MASVKMRNATNKDARKNARTTVAAKQKKKQQRSMDALLCGLDALAEYAGNSNMGMATRIFFLAKEELVHWAVTMNFYESAQDRFINEQLYDRRISAKNIAIPSAKTLQQSVRK